MLITKKKSLYPSWTSWSSRYVYLIAYLIIFLSGCLEGISHLTKARDKSWFHLCPCSMPSSLKLLSPNLFLAQQMVSCLPTWILKLKSTCHPLFFSSPLSSTQSMNKSYHVSFQTYPKSVYYSCIYSNPLFKALSLSLDSLGLLQWHPLLSSLLAF